MICSVLLGSEKGRYFIKFCNISWSALMLITHSTILQEQQSGGMLYYTQQNEICRFCLNDAGRHCFGYEGACPCLFKNNVDSLSFVKLYLSFVKL